MAKMACINIERRFAVKYFLINFNKRLKQIVYVGNYW